MKKIMRKLSCLLLIAALTVCLTGCSDKDSGSKEVVYEDMKASFEQADLRSCCIGIFSKTESGDSVTYGECGSGVIFKEEDGTYFALTAAHVVSDSNAQLLVFTVNTEMTPESVPGLSGLNILTQDVYDAMYPAELEYVSTRDDLAVLSFQTEESLSVIRIAEADPQIGDRILCVGNPQNEWFRISYGKVTSGIETFGELRGYPSNAMKHSAYIQVGSSGGPAINEKMQLAGITPGASLSLDGKTFNYGVLIPVSEINLCLNEWAAQGQE